MSDEDRKKKRKDRNTGAVSSMDPGTPEGPEQPGMATADEAAEALEDSGVMDSLPKTNLEGYEIPEEFEGDPERLEELRAKLKEQGDMATATEALEELAKIDPNDLGADAGESGVEGIPFEQVAERTGVSADELLVTAKVDGEEVQVPLSEAVNGFQRREVFTKRTQELAEIRNEAEQTRDQYAQALEAVAGTLGQALSPEAQEYVLQEYQAVQQQRQQEIEQARAQVVPQEQERLEEALGWEGEEAEKGRQRLREYAREQGFEDSTLNSILDHRAFVALEKARRWDKAQSAVEEGRVKRKNRNLQPGTSGSRKSGKSVSDARKRLAKTGSLRDATATLEGLLS